MDLLMAGGAVKVLLVSLSCPLPLLRAHPPSWLVCCIFVFEDMGPVPSCDSILTAGGKPIFVEEARWQEPLK